ncbi:UNVERIFIED_CONTAM: Transposon Tf2-11 polyprotein [Sesamum latifolium]|uniref:Transposon Tf2-11 polyprotein n=1 Tax=Sesamum latifolium TaxID=2727402 RepID=A0AAW2UIS3_9LAMI
MHWFRGPTIGCRWWDDIETYVRTCLICQQDKADHQKKAGLLQPLPIPKRPWESVSMDYISGLPKVGDLGSIIVVVDRLSKYTTFIAARKHITMEGMAHLFFKHIVKYWGLPKDIVSDRDSRFTSIFWTELFKILESKLFMSSSYHPQSDGQTKRFNSMLEEYLWHFVRGTQKDRVMLLDVPQLCFNAKKSSSTNKSTFEIVTGQQPLLPHILEIYKEDDAHNQPSRPQLELTKTKEKVAEAILNHRVTCTAKCEHTEYLVKWKGCSSEENTWERVTNLKVFLPLFEAYHASHAPRTSSSQVGENVKGCRAVGTLDAYSAAQPLNLANRLRRQTLGFHSLRVLGVGLFSCIYCKDVIYFHCS